MPQYPNLGQFGKIKVEEDFTRWESDIDTTAAGTGLVPGEGGVVSVGNVDLVSANAGSLAWTVDEPGGILAITTDTADDNDAYLIAAPMKPSVNGTLEMECRFKDPSLSHLVALVAGWSQTMSLSAPITPASFATVTMTYAGTGDMVGIIDDQDATTDDFRAFAGTGGAGTGGSSTTGIRANDAVVADEFFVARVEVDPNGASRVYLGHKGGTNGALNLVSAFPTVAGGAVPFAGTNLLFPFLGILNRDGNAQVLEADYLVAYGWRDWNVAVP